jgi:tryptophan halogenase
MKINSVVIVGGGTSGWMTAAALSKYNLNVSLVESKSVPTVGVGESTVLLINNFLKMVGLKDEDWMKACNATYKSSIRFTDFYKKGTVFEYPFDRPLTEEGLGKWSLINASYDLPPESFCEFFSDTYFLAKYNRLTKDDSNLDINFDNQTAYHFDAKLFGQYLKDNVCKDVRHYYDNIVGVKKDENGYVESLVGQLHGKYEGDLFIDCTGFGSHILEKEMGSEFKSFKPWLPNDKAIACNLPYTNKNEQLNNVTNCTALGNGWSWNIPLWNRMGTGYVYSSDFVSDEAAETEFVRHLGTDDVDFRKINIRHGIREKGWVKNVVGIGLSYAFVEPLESTSLVSTHEMIFYLCETLSRKNYNVSGFDIDSYNYNASLNITKYRDFVALHYKLSSRTDTPYWRHQTDKEWPEQDVGPDFYNDLHRMHSLEHRWKSQNSDGLLYLLAGMGQKPYGKFLYNTLGETKAEEIYNDFRKDVKDIEDHVKTLPSTSEFLKKHIYT